MAVPAFRCRFAFASSARAPPVRLRLRGRLVADRPQRGDRTRAPAPHLAQRSDRDRRAPARFRRVVDVAYVVAGLGVLLRHFGVDSTPALAGVGVGGIAVALAAQKTLENVIAGASLIFDQAVKVGDFLKVGRGGRDRGAHWPALHPHPHSRSTVVSIPNSQIAGATSKRCPHGTSSGSTRKCGCATRRRRRSCVASSRDAGSCLRPSTGPA